MNVKEYLNLYKIKIYYKKKIVHYNCKTHSFYTTHEMKDD